MSFSSTMSLLDNFSPIRATRSYHFLEARGVTEKSKKPRAHPSGTACSESEVWHTLVGRSVEGNGYRLEKRLSGTGATYAELIVLSNGKGQVGFTAVQARPVDFQIRRIISSQIRLELGRVWPSPISKNPVRSSCRGCEMSLLVKRHSRLGFEGNEEDINSTSTISKWHV